MTDITTLTSLLDEEERRKLNLLDFDSAGLKRKKKTEGEEGDGESGSDGITLSVEQLNAYLLACFTKERREGQKKFGPVPYTEDPNSLLGKKRGGSVCGERPHIHPLLALSQQFSGDDPRITANPVENAKASEHYLELRNENRLRKNPELGRRKSVTLSR